MTRSVEVLSTTSDATAHYVTTMVTQDDGTQTKTLQRFDKTAIQGWSQHFGVDDVDTLMKLLIYDPYVEGVIKLDDLDQVVAALAPKQNSTRLAGSVLRSGIEEGLSHVRKVQQSRLRDTGGARSGSPLPDDPIGRRSLPDGGTDGPRTVLPSRRRSVVARKPAHYPSADRPSVEGPEPRRSGEVPPLV